MQNELENCVIHLRSMHDVARRHDAVVGGTIYKADMGASKMAADILAFMHRQGVDTKDQALAMIGKHTPAAPFRKDGVWHCPTCNSRAKVWHSYCHQCGQRMNWGRFQK